MTPVCHLWPSEGHLPCGHLASSIKRDTIPRAGIQGKGRERRKGKGRAVGVQGTLAQDTKGLSDAMGRGSVGPCEIECMP